MNIRDYVFGKTGLTTRERDAMAEVRSWDNSAFENVTNALSEIKRHTKNYAESDTFLYGEVEEFKDIVNINDANQDRMMAYDLIRDSKLFSNRIIEGYEYDKIEGLELLSSVHTDELALNDQWRTNTCSSLSDKVINTSNVIRCAWLIEGGEDDDVVLDELYV